MLHIVVGKGKEDWGQFLYSFLPNMGLAPTWGKYRRLLLLESHEAYIGTSVAVLDGARRPGKGSVGTIVQTFGHPDYLAVDVLLDDGSVELYWHYQLRTMERGVAGDGNGMRWS
jgi:hypothetical protein